MKALSKITTALVAATLSLAVAVQGQQTSTQAAPISQTSVTNGTGKPVTRDEMKAQRKQQKQQEKASNTNAKAAKSQAKAKKDQDKALQEQEKANGVVPKS